MTILLPQDGDMVICANGDLDRDTAPTFRDNMTKLIGSLRVEQVLLDLSGLTFCDSAGMRALEELGENPATAGRVHISATAGCVDLVLSILEVETLLGYRVSRPPAGGVSPAGGRRGRPGSGRSRGRPG